MALDEPQDFDFLEVSHLFPIFLKQLVEFFNLLFLCFEYHLLEIIDQGYGPFKGTYLLEAFHSLLI